MSSNIMILAASKGSIITPKKSTTPPTRPESPGGYFTLSDSDGAGSNLEYSSSDQDLHHAASPPRSMYKIYKQASGVVVVGGGRDNNARNSINNNITRYM